MNLYIYINKKTYNSGFTLIELLIAISILSIILTAIYSTFFLSYKAINDVDEAIIKMQELRTALDILRREINSAVYESGYNKTFFKIIDKDFKGKSANEVRFTTFSVLIPGISEVSYYVDERDSKLILHKKIKSIFNREDGQATDIIEDIDEFSVEARYNDKWVKTWDTEINKSLPEELRITLSVNIKGESLKLSEIVKPYIAKSLL